MFDMEYGNQDHWEMNEDEWEMNDEELQSDLDADGWEKYQVIDPDNVEPPAKEE